MKNNKNKGCLNPECEENQNRVYFSETDNFCPKCGRPLEYVCQNKKCFKPVGPEDKFCKLCDAEQSDKKDRALEVAGKVGQIVLNVGGIVLSGVLGKDINFPKKKM